MLFGGLWLDGYSRVGTDGATGLVADYAAAALGVQCASDRAMAGAANGAVLDAFAGLPGLIVGPVLGPVTGEWSVRRHVRQATRAGVAAGLKLVVALPAKLGLTLGMLGVFA